jgi:hypothetical protein
MSDEIRIKEGTMAATSLSQLVEMAKRVQMNHAQRMEQRNSFVYGNTKIENDKITKEMVERVAKRIQK